MDNLLSDMITALFALASFAGGLAAIIGAGAASIAAIFAWNGLKKIEKELVDQRDQIKELAIMAAELKKQNEFNDRAVRLSMLPILNVSFSKNQGKYFTEGVSTAYYYIIRNDGKTAFDLDIKLPLDQELKI